MEKGKQVEIMMHLKGRTGNFMRMLNLWWEMMSKNIRKVGQGLNAQLTNLDCIWSEMGSPCKFMIRVINVQITL